MPSNGFTERWTRYVSKSPMPPHRSPAAYARSLYRPASVITSRPFLDAAFPSGATVTGIPQFYTMTSDTQISLGPVPDQAYPIEFIGLQRPSPLSSANSSTFLTQYCPELFIAASMVFAFGYMRDFGGQADNPQGSQSWENQYKTLFPSAEAEIKRAKHQAQAWTPYSA